MVALPHEVVWVRDSTWFSEVDLNPITLASKFMIATGAGVIDADYRGIVFVLLFNHSQNDFKGSFIRLLSFRVLMATVVEVGDRVAQLIIEKIETPEVLEVQVRYNYSVTPRSLLIWFYQDLEETLRGAGGFGSTGGHKAL